MKNLQDCLIGVQESGVRSQEFKKSGVQEVSEVQELRVQ